MKELRAFQSKAIADLRVELRSNAAVVVVAPTGAGKTVLAAFIAGGVSASGKRVWFVCNRDFLLDQTAGTFADMGLDFGFIAANRPFNPHAMINICSIDTLRNRIDIIPPHLRPDYIIWDETHHAAAGSWRRVFEWAAGAKHVGFTATPVRLDGRGLDDLYTSMVQCPQLGELIALGYLSKYRAFCPSSPDTSNLRMRAGDFAADDVADLMDRGAIIGDMVRHYRERAYGKRAVYFCANVSHSEHVAAAFTASGMPFVHMDGTTPSMERRAVCRALARGDIMGITNVGLFGEGFDLAAQAQMDVSIDCLGMARMTQSLGFYMQMVGRVLRMSEGKEYGIILDHAGNVLRHGLPDEERIWSLEGAGKDKKAGAGVGVKACKGCLSQIPSTAQKCTYCGYVYETEAKAIEHVDGELYETTAADVAAYRKKREAECETVTDYFKLAKETGIKDPAQWAAKKFTTKNSRGKTRAQHQWESYMR